VSSKRQIGRPRVLHLQTHGHITTENDFPALLIKVWYMYMYKLPNHKFEKGGPMCFKFIQMQSTSILSSFFHYVPSCLSCVLFEFFYSFDPFFWSLSGSPTKSGPLDSQTKNTFPSFFVSKKGWVHIYKNATYYFPVSYFCLARSQNWIWGELKLPSVLKNVKLTNFVKRATSPEKQLTEFRFHAISKVHSLLWL